ncbi:testis-expressed protein 2-like [Protopterus annectens]|uniref:testis-expressed protein 2-like n=1 Tax=Protopterus annectens TaxID=7888 RepID=UPI001CF9DE8F|nr:testis-expressed protein 2-like [Protopterus annectens]
MMSTTSKDTTETESISEEVQVKVEGLYSKSKEIVIQFSTAAKKGGCERYCDDTIAFCTSNEDDAAAAALSEEAVSSEENAYPHASEGPSFQELHLPSYSVCKSEDDPPSSDQLVQTPQLKPLVQSDSTASKPLINLVKSLSAEIEARDMPSLRPKPLLNLVKSISTELSQQESEVIQSKSDSKLNLLLWKQLTQPKNKNSDSKTAPSSPSISPSENKGGLFKVQEVEARLEDTKRKLSEAMLEPFSMLSKIIGEEHSGTPKHKAAQPSTYVTDSQNLSNSITGDESFEINTTTTQARYIKRGNAKPYLGETLKTKQHKDSASFGYDGDFSSKTSRYEIHTYEDMIQVVEVEEREDTREQQPSVSNEVAYPLPSCQTLPCTNLLCFTLMAYGYFILPLPTYIAGVCLGLACGFMLAFLVIILLLSRPPPLSVKKKHANERLHSDILINEPKETDIMQGWMNEIYFYKPELYHASLTHSVYVTLEGSSLKLSYPKNNIPRKATFEEAKHDVVFTSERCYNLSESKVSLAPPGLAKKRMWNKKYPICLILAEQSGLSSQTFTESTAVDNQISDSENLCVPTARANDTRNQSGQTKEGILYLFGRTGREKEEWYQHFLVASRITAEEKYGSRCEERLGTGQNRGSSPSGRLLHSNCSSRGSMEDIASLFKPKDLAGKVKQKILLDYNTYMSRFIPGEGASPLLSPCHSATSSPTTRRKLLRDVCTNNEPHLAWINAFIGRIFWDFLREKYWADQVTNKIQKKLSKIKLPYFMNELSVTELDMGTSLPVIQGASKPVVDHRGLWLDLEVTYTGSLQMTLVTKLNLCKLRKEGILEGDGQINTGREGTKPREFILADSDEESSTAGSSDEEDVPLTEPQGTLGDKIGPAGVESYIGGQSTSRKILRFVDKIAKSKYFQKATENEFIKKKIEEVSNTPLLLTVEVQELTGTLAVNIPPPPTDRIWYSFHIPPQLELKVRPKLGEREVTFSHVTEWIEKKLKDEFQKVFVMPNMDDLYILVMHSGLDISAQHLPCSEGQSENTVTVPEEKL